MHTCNFACILLRSLTNLISCLQTSPKIKKKIINSLFFSATLYSLYFGDMKIKNLHLSCVKHANNQKNKYGSLITIVYNQKARKCSSYTLLPYFPSCNNGEHLLSKKRCSHTSLFFLPCLGSGFTQGHQ